jgi:hypothetical protein
MKDLKRKRPTTLRDLGREYVPAFVTFIDILGFSNLVGTDSAAAINDRLDSMKFFSKLPQTRSPEYQAKKYLPISYQVSDSIIRVQPLPIDSEQQSACICDFYAAEIEAVLLSQMNLACNGVFIRGGITFGNVCVHDSRIFGPAFIRAYKLESSQARFPRIVVDQSICSSTANNPITSICGQHNWSRTWQHISELLRQDTDGQWFLNYLSPHVIPTKDRKGILEAHRDEVVLNYERAIAARAEEVASKYFWVASYHNDLVETWYPASSCNAGMGEALKVHHE